MYVIRSYQTGSGYKQHNRFLWCPYLKDVSWTDSLAMTFSVNNAISLSHFSHMVIEIVFILQYFTRPARAQREHSISFSLEEARLPQFLSNFGSALALKYTSKMCLIVFRTFLNCGICLMMSTFFTGILASVITTWNLSLFWDYRLG